MHQISGKEDSDKLRGKIATSQPHEEHYKKLSCRREIARCFVSLNILLSHSRSLEVIGNDTLEKGVSPCW